MHTNSTLYARIDPQWLSELRRLWPSIHSRCTPLITNQKKRRRKKVLRKPNVDKCCSRMTTNPLQKPRWATTPTACCLGHLNRCFFVCFFNQQTTLAEWNIWSLRAKTVLHDSLHWLHARRNVSRTSWKRNCLHCSHSHKFQTGCPGKSRISSGDDDINDNNHKYIYFLIQCKGEEEWAHHEIKGPKG